MILCNSRLSCQSLNLEGWLVYTSVPWDSVGAGSYQRLIGLGTIHSSDRSLETACKEYLPLSRGDNPMFNKAHGRGQNRCWFTVVLLVTACWTQAQGEWTAPQETSNLTERSKSKEPNIQNPTAWPLFILMIFLKLPSSDSSNSTCIWRFPVTIPSPWAKLMETRPYST